MGSGCNEIQINLFYFKIDNFQETKGLCWKKKTTTKQNKKQPQPKNDRILKEKQNLI